MNTLDIRSYLAGFFDGEGSVGINRFKTKNGYSYRVQVQACQADPRPINLLKKMYRGSISVDKDPRKESYKLIYHWVCTDRIANEFLLDISDLLIVKREKAIMALEYLSLPRLNNICHVKNIYEETRKTAEKHNINVVKQREAVYGKWKENF